MMKEPEINVGIVNAQEIHFSLNGRFFAKGETVCGEQSVSFSEGGILWNGNLYRELTFTPQDERTSFSLYDVTIGINFHWERQETQSFMGTLKLVVDEGKITAINILPVEDYLISVISSEMNATSSLEFLKAHAVVSRSWLFAQMEKRKALCNKNEGMTAKTTPSSTCVPTTTASVIRESPKHRTQQSPKLSTPHAANCSCTVKAFAMPVSPNVAEE